MLTSNPVLKFLIMFILAFGLLIAPWPGLGNAFAKFFVNQVEWISGILGPNAFIQFSEGQGHLDTQINIANAQQLAADKTVEAAYFTVGSRQTAYLPFVLFIALIIATPISLKRKLLAFPLGVLLVYLFVAFKIIVLFLYNYNLQEWIGLFQFEGFTERLVNFSYSTIANPLPPTILMIFLIWIMVCFRKDDWKELLIAKG